MENDLIISKPLLTEEEKEDVLMHLKKGGSPFSAPQVTGISKDRLMECFKTDIDFAQQCSKARAKSLAKLEYAIYDLAESGPPREAVKALELLLKANIPELYNVSNSKTEEKIKKLVKDGN